MLYVPLIMAKTKETPTAAPLTLAQRKTVWRANAPFTALGTLAAGRNSCRSLVMAIDTFATDGDLRSIETDLEAVLAWMKARPVV